MRYEDIIGRLEHILQRMRQERRFLMIGVEDLLYFAENNGMSTYKVNRLRTAARSARHRNDLAVEHIYRLIDRLHEAAEREKQGR